jgi:hypothetical protein
VYHGLLTVEASLSMRHTTNHRTAFDEGSARHRCLCQTAHTQSSQGLEFHVPAEIEPGNVYCFVKENFESGRNFKKLIPKTGM